MSEDNGQTNGTSNGGDVPEIELIIKVKLSKSLYISFKKLYSHSPAKIL